MILSHFTLT